MKINLIYIPVILLFLSSCQEKDLGLNANYNAPKGLVITENLVRVVDSSFSFTDEKRVFKNVQTWEFDKGFIQSSSFESNEGGTNKSKYDNFGRKTESVNYSPKNKTTTTLVLSYDKYGNEVLSRMSEKLDTNETEEVKSFFRTTYIYDENGNMLRKEKRSALPSKLQGTSNLADFFEYAYDERGNQIQAISTLIGIKDDKVYDNDNNLIEYIRLNTNRHTLIHKENNIYEDGLLVKTITGKSEYNTAHETYFEYNEKGQLVKEYDSFSTPSITKYLDYDSFGNWTREEIFEGNKLQRFRTRTIVYK